ncbi:hypothetical protein ACRS9B_11950 [Achromobacter xylosoxidans]|uniref:hypothetical protein n=1 Tax=Alcaligenes xylosoxydans xylosoxydans TaxID=85698 RepID=UPI003EDE9AA9
MSVQEEGKSSSEKVDELDAMVEEGTPNAVNPAFNDSQDKALANLERLLEKERDKRQEERFLFVTMIVALADAYFFKEMNNWGAPIVIGLVQLVALIVFARMCGVQEVDRLLDRIMALPPIRQLNGRYRKEREEFAAWKKSRRVKS